MTSNIRTDKDAFEYVKEQLLKQNEKSMTKKYCSYRGYSEFLQNLVCQNLFGVSKNSLHNTYYARSQEAYIEMHQSLEVAVSEQKPDLKCAIGHLIDEEHYDKKLENKGIGSNEVHLAVVSSNPSWNIDETSEWMLHHLQDLHDSENIENWSSQLGKFVFNSDGSFDGISRY